jgi:uncharacterized protein YjdB
VHHICHLPRSALAAAGLLLAACLENPIVPTDNPSVGAAPPSAVAGVTMRYTSVELVVGETMQLGATPRTSTGAGTAATSSVSWISTAPSVATVDANALVTAVSPGTANIIATFDGHSGMTIVTVKAAPPPGSR